jgi:hypothetical protein
MIEDDLRSNFESLHAANSGGHCDRVEKHDLSGEVGAKGGVRVKTNCLSSILMVWRRTFSGLMLDSRKRNVNRVHSSWKTE